MNLAAHLINPLKHKYQMYRLIADITIGAYRFDYVNDVVIENSWENFTSTATITIPRKLKIKNKNLVVGETPIFKKGQRVIIRLGYALRLFESINTVFEGYISDISPEIPFKIMAQDAMWILKQQAITHSWRKVELKDMIQEAQILAGRNAGYGVLDVVADSINLGNFRATRVTVAQILEEIKKSYGFYSYIRNKKLYIGKIGTQLDSNTIQLSFQEDIVSSDLVYLRKDEQKIKAKAISILPNNTKIEVESGDKEGELRTFTYYNLQKKDLKKVVKQEIERIRIDGYKGSFTTFLVPQIMPMDIVTLDDSENPDRRGNYLVKSVVTNFGQGGGRQKVTLDRKV